MTAVICAASVLQATTLGSSVLIDGLNATFNEPQERFAFHGLYAKVLSLLVANIVAGQLLLWFARHPRMKEPVCAVGVFLPSIGLLVSGVGATLCDVFGRGSPGGVALLYLGMTCLFGSGQGVLELATCYWGLLYWDLSGEKGRGVGLFGGALGVGAIFWTLSSLWLITSTTVAGTLYAMAAMQAVMAVPLAWSVRTGLLSSPPSQDEYDVWSGASKSPDSASPPPAVQAGLRAAGTSALFPEKVSSTVTMLTRPVAHLQLVCGMITAFVGYATKTLMSTMLIVIFDLTLTQAGYYSAAALVLFAAGRFSIPFFLIDRIQGNASLVIRGASQLGTAGLFVALPFLANADNAAGFITVKSFSGLLFAVSATVSGSSKCTHACLRACAQSLLICAYCLTHLLYVPVGLSIFGGASLAAIMIPGWLTFGMAGAAGPIVAYCVSQQHVYEGKPTDDSYDAYFFGAAAASFANFLVILAMGALEIAAERREQRLIANRTQRAV